MSSDDTALDRISSFISENKRGVVIGAAAAAVAVGGVAYYVASSRAGLGSGDEESLRGAKKKDKKKRKHRKSGKDKDGPILEEKKPKATDESDDGKPTQFPQPPSTFARSLTFIVGPDQSLTEEQIQALDTGVSMPLSCPSALLFHPVLIPINRNASRSRLR